MSGAVPSKPGSGPSPSLPMRQKSPQQIEEAGGRAVLTRADHPSGSDRIHEAMETLDPQGAHDVIVNVQGDFPTIDPRAIAASVLPLADSAVMIATLACPITEDREALDPNVVKVVGSQCATGRLRAL